VPPGGGRPLGQRLQPFLPFPQPLHPHRFRHQMLTCLTSKGLTDAQIQRISGHESKKSFAVCQPRSLESVDKAYQEAVQSVGI
jgi:integrase/recombinase XerD